MANKVLPPHARQPGSFKGKAGPGSGDSPAPVKVLPPHLQPKKGEKSPSVVATPPQKATPTPVHEKPAVLAKPTNQTSGPVSPTPLCVPKPDTSEAAAEPDYVAPYITCVTCKRKKARSSYFKHCLATIDRRIRAITVKAKPATFDPIKQPLVACIPCSPKEAVEKQCYECDKWKSVDAFSVTQRKKDEGICKTCREDRDAMDADDPLGDWAQAQAESEDDNEDEDDAGTKTFSSSES